MPKQKQKKQNLSKEQVAGQMKQIEKSQRLRKLAREKVYPTLFKAENISTAKIICQVIEAIASAKVANYWADKKFSDLGLIEELKSDASSQDLDLYLEILTALNEEDIVDVQEILATMGKALDGYLLKEAKTRAVPDVSEIIND